MFTIGLDNDWLQYRWDIFTKFTVPSVAAQTYTDFDWVILCHRRSPQWLREQAQTLKLPCGVRLSFDKIDPTLDDLKDPALEVVLTIRIDSDDAWHCCAMARIRECFEADPYSCEILNFEVGYQYDSLKGRLALMRWLSPPFNTRINFPPILDPLDVGGAHNKLYMKYSYRDISQGDPMLLRVIHGANVHSRINCNFSNKSRY